MTRRVLPRYFVLPSPDEQLTFSEAAPAIVSNVGFGFMYGTAVGSVYHFLKGFLFSDPNSNSNSNSTTTSIRSRLGGGLAMARANAPLVGGRLALFFALNILVRAPLAALQGDNKVRFAPFRPATQFISGSAAAAAISAARGPRAALRSALLGGSLSAFPEFFIINLELLVAADNNLPHAAACFTKNKKKIKDHIHSSLS